MVITGRDGGWGGWKGEGGEKDELEKKSMDVKEIQKHGES